MKKRKYSGRFVQVYEEPIENKVYEKVYIHDSIIIIPFVNDDEILLVKEKRVQEDPPVRIKTVTGFYESEFSFEENVNRELQEEIGKKANRIVQYEVIKRTGLLNDTRYFALAYDLEDSKLPNPDGEDTIMEVIRMSLDELYDFVMSGRFPLGDTAFLLVRLYMEIKGKKSGMNTSPSDKT